MNLRIANCRQPSLNSMDAFKAAKASMQHALLWLAGNLLPEPPTPGQCLKQAELSSGQFQIDIYPYHRFGWTRGEQSYCAQHGSAVYFWKDEGQPS